MYLPPLRSLKLFDFNYCLNLQAVSLVNLQTGKGSIIMAMEMWIAFAITSAVMLSIPGPTVILIVSYIAGPVRV